MRLWLKRIGAGLAVLALAGGLFVYAGVYNVSARAGHLAPTAWLLHLAMRKSARTYSLGIEVPPLEDERMVIRGATWFSLGCAPCHGEPGNTSPPIVDNMTPPAPRLSPLIDDWRTRELFWIVDNGIKYTGMPAWATPERPDEIWSMVAFLLRLPHLDAAEYRKLAYNPGSEEVPPAITRLELDERVGTTLAQCARCHGFDGMGRGTGAFPYLAGQKETYLYQSLRHYALGERMSGIMQPVAGGLLIDAMRELAAWYADAAPASPPPVQAVDPERAARGAQIAAEGLPRQGVPACRHCHGPGEAAANPYFPRIAGQNEAYLVRQLELWSSASRGGTEYFALMTEAANGLTPEQMRDVAAWYAALPYFGAGGEPGKP